MPRPVAAIFGSLLAAAGCVGFYVWWGEGYGRDDSYGLFMLSSVGVLAGLHMIMKSIGLNIFGSEGSADSGVGLFDGDGDGDGD
jgi:hypothetical protein